MGLLVVLSPQGMTDQPQSPEDVDKVTGQTDKPVLASWMRPIASAEAEIF